LLVFRTDQPYDIESCTIAWFFSATVGALCLPFLPLARSFRVLLIVVYIPLMLCSLVYYFFWFGGFVFDEWL